MHPLLEQIFTTGISEMADGSPATLSSSISREDCAAVERVIARYGASSAVEVGMAFGISTLAIADALSRNGSARMVSIDPHQSVGWNGAGMHLLRRAGLGEVVELIEEPSQLALPGLAARGQRFDFAFIDGWHTFDHTLIDFFYCDWMLEPGGVVMLDDVSFPAIDRVVRFILANRDYEVVDVTQYDDTTSPGLRFRRSVKRLLRPLARTDHDASPANERLFRGIDRAVVVALRKRGNDARPFDHFEPF
jgi:predicted O-methyltransferase YrrM